MADTSSEAATPAEGLQTIQSTDELPAPQQRLPASPAAGSARGSDAGLSPMGLVPQSSGDGFGALMQTVTTLPDVCGRPRFQSTLIAPSKLPPAVSPPPRLAEFQDHSKKTPMYFIRVVEKRDGKSHLREQKRVMILTASRLLLVEIRPQNIKRWPSYDAIESPILFKNVKSKKGLTREYLIRVPSEGVDMLLHFVQDERNDDETSSCEQFEQTLTQLIEARGFAQGQHATIEFEEVAEDVLLEKKGQLDKPEEFREGMKSAKQILKDKEKEERKRQDSGSPRARQGSASPLAWIGEKTASFRSGSAKPPMSPSRTTARQPSELTGDSAHDSDSNAGGTGELVRPRQGSTFGPDLSSMTQQSAGLDTSLLPPAATIPPKLAKFDDPAAPQLYFIRVVEKRSAKSQWQKRVVLLSAAQLMLAELGSTKLKRWSRLEDIASPIRVQSVVGKKGAAVAQYLIRVPSEGVDMLLQFGGDERNEEGATGEVFEERVGAVMRARGLHVEFERVGGEVVLEKEAQLEKPKDFVKEKRRSSRAFSVGADGEESGAGQGWLARMRNRTGSVAPEGPEGGHSPATRNRPGSIAPMHGEEATIESSVNPESPASPARPVDASLLPPPIPPAPQFAFLYGPDSPPLYYFRMVEKRSSKGALQKRILVLTQNRLVLSELKGKSAETKRWPRFADIQSPILKETIAMDGAETVQYLVKVPSEGVDMLLVFAEDARNDPETAGWEVFEERMVMMFAARGMELEFETVAEDGALADQAKLSKTKELKDIMKADAKRINQLKKDKQRAGSLMGSDVGTPSAAALPPVSPSSCLRPSPPPLEANAPASPLPDAGTSDGPMSPTSEAPADAPDFTAMPADASHNSRPFDTSLLPPAATIPPKLAKFDDPAAPQLYFIRVVEKRSAKSQWQKRVVLLSAAQLMLAELGSTKLKRWSRLEDIASPIRVQSVVGKKGAAVAQYLIRVPSEGVDILLQFGGDERNEEGATGEVFEERVGAVMRARGLHVEFERVGGEVVLEKEAQLEKPKDFVKEKRRSSRAFSVGAGGDDGQHDVGGGNQGWLGLFRNRAGSAATDSPSVRDRPGSIAPMHGEEATIESSVNPESPASPARPVDASLLPPPIPPAPQFAFLYGPDSPPLYYFRMVEKRSSKGALQKRILVLTQNRLVLSELKGKSAETKRWPRFADIQSPILKETIAMDGAETVQYLVKVPSEGVDMLLVFAEDARNDPETAGWEVFEERMVMMFAARGMELEFQIVGKDGALADQAKLQKTKELKDIMKADAKRINQLKKDKQRAGSLAGSDAGGDSPPPPTTGADADADAVDTTAEDPETPQVAQLERTTSLESAGVGDNGVHPGLTASVVNPTILPPPVVAPLALSQYSNASAPVLYYIRVVEKCCSNGRWDKRVLLVTSSRVILADVAAKPTLRRWPALPTLNPTILYTPWEDKRGQAAKQYLLRVPGDGVDMLLRWCHDDKNDADTASCGVFEERFAAIMAAAGLSVEFKPLVEEAGENAKIGDHAQLKKSREFAKALKDQRMRLSSVAEGEKELAVDMGPDSPEAAWLPRSDSVFSVVSPDSSGAVSNVTGDAEAEVEGEEDASVLADEPADADAPDFTAMPADASHNSRPFDTSLLPPAATIPPKLAKFDDPAAPQLYFIRVVEKRSAKSQWQKRVVLLSAAQLMLAELGSTKLKRWSRLEDIASPIRVQSVVGKKGAAVAQYLIRVPSEGVDMLLQFGGDERNEEGATGEVFEERVGAVMRARGLHVEFERVGGEVVLEKEAQLEKPKDFVKEKRKAARAFSVGSDAGASKSFLGKLRGMSVSPKHSPAASPASRPEEDPADAAFIEELMAVDPAAPPRVPAVTADVSLLPFPVSATPKLAMYDAPDAPPMYYIRCVEKLNSKGKWDKRVLVISETRFLLAEGVGKRPVLKRWPKVVDLASPVLFKRVTLPGSDVETKEYLVRVPSEGQDMYLRFAADDRNDPATAGCEVFEERLDQVLRAWGVGMAFKEVPGHMTLGKHAQLEKTKELKASMQETRERMASLQAEKDKEREKEGGGGVLDAVQSRAASLMGMRQQRSVEPQASVSPTQAPTEREQREHSAFGDMLEQTLGSSSVASAAGQNQRVPQVPAQVQAVVASPHRSMDPPTPVASSPAPAGYISISSPVASGVSSPTSPYRSTPRRRDVPPEKLISENRGLRGKSAMLADYARELVNLCEVLAGGGAGGAGAAGVVSEPVPHVPHSPPHASVDHLLAENHALREVCKRQRADVARLEAASAGLSRANPVPDSPIPRSSPSRSPAASASPMRNHS